MAPRSLRLLIFSDVNVDVTAALISETVRLARLRGTLEVCGIVTSRPDQFGGTAALRALRLGRRALVAATNRDVPLRSIASPLLDLRRFGERTGIPVVSPVDGDPNRPGFLRMLETMDPDVALSYFCLSVFRPPLLERFEQAVNFHDAVLPHHRGMLATSFSVYAGDRATGFTYHRMTPDIDAGPILVQGSVPIGRDEPIATIRARQLAAARAALPEVLDLVADGHPGRPQTGSGSYHSRRDARAIVTVEDPRSVTSEDLARRLRAFGRIHITIDGCVYPVTRIRRSRTGERLAFPTSEGSVRAPDRINGLPVRLFRMTRPLYGA